MQELKDRVKDFYSSFMWHSGLLFGWLAIRPGRQRVTILNYHRIDSRAFEQHLRCLTRACNIVTIEECCKYLQGNGALPANSIVITFDDGYAEFYHEIYPVVKAFNVPVTVFLPTGSIDNGDILWFNQVQAVVHTIGARSVTVGSSTIPLTTDRHHAYLTAVGHLNEQPVAERDKAIRALLESMPLDAKATACYQPLTWGQIRDMRGLVSYGAHTVAHPNLGKLGRDLAVQEILTSKKRIEEEVGCEVKCFAYPFGCPSHFTDETLDILRDARFQFAFTTCRGPCAVGDDLLTLRRVTVDGTINGRVLVTRLSGLWLFLTT